jgi:hypothetical protein
MKPYYYVFKPVGHPPIRKHDTLEDAVKESQRLCEMHPNQTFEVLQCLAITSAPKPQVSTFYVDGVRTDKDEQYIGFPLGMPLPQIPDGYCEAHYRGMGWKPRRECYYASMDLHDPAPLWRNRLGIPAESPAWHYCEFIK